WRQAIRRAVGVCVLLACQTPALPSPPNSPLLSTYLPQITYTLANLNSKKSLALVDTLSFRKHVTGNDGLDGTLPVPTQYRRQLSGAGCPTSTDPCVMTIAYPNANGDGGTHPQDMYIQSTAEANAGYNLGDSTGRRWLQFAILSIGPLDDPINPNGFLTTQVWY